MKRTNYLNKEFVLDDMLRRIEQKKEKRRKFWMGAILVFLMIFSIMGILVGNSGTESWKYNDFKFTKQENFFITQINGEYMSFNFLPQSLDQIKTPINLNNKLKSPVIYLSFNPNLNIKDLTYLDTIRNDFQKLFDNNIIGTISEESDVYKLPLINCNNATPFVPVFYFNISNSTSIIENNNCIILNSKSVDLLKIRDLLVYHYYGVIND